MVNTGFLVKLFQKKPKWWYNFFMKKSKNNNIILGFGYWVFEFGFSWCKWKVIYFQNDAQFLTAQYYYFYCRNENFLTLAILICRMLQDVKRKKKIQNASASRIPGGLFYPFYTWPTKRRENPANNFQSITKTLVIYIDFLKIFKMFFLLL